MYIYIYTYIHVYTKSLSTTKKLYISTCIVQSCLCFYHNTIARLKHRHEQRGANQTRSNWLAANAWVTPGNTNPRHSEGSACKKPNLRKKRVWICEVVETNRTICDSDTFTLKNGWCWNFPAIVFQGWKMDGIDSSIDISHWASDWSLSSCQALRWGIWISCVRESIAAEWQQRVQRPRGWTMALVPLCNEHQWTHNEDEQPTSHKVQNMGVSLASAV